MKKLLVISYSILTIGIICLGVLNILMVQNEEALAEKQEQRYQSYLLADQLRQSSDDLTRMARTYVITGDAQYEKMYWDILAIRNGDKLRPQGYNRIYWDFVLTYGNKPRPDDKAIALQELMKQAGFTEKEFAKLRKAQKNSDALVKTETIAMNAVKGLYYDGSGNYVKKGEPDLEMAKRIIHDVQYHKDKAIIMGLIDDFFQLLDERTKAQVEYHAKKADLLLFMIEIVLLLLVIFAVAIGIFVTTRILKQVGGEPAEIAQMIEQVANGELNLPFDSIQGKTATGLYASVQMVANNFKTVIEDIVQVSDGLAKGNLRVTPEANYNGEFVKVKNALETGLSNLQQVVEDMVQVSQGLASGNLQVTPKAEYRGDFVQIKKALKTGLSNLREVLEDIVQMSQGLSEGSQDVSAKAEYQGDFIQVKNALETAATKLAEATTRNATQDWLKTGQTQLSQEISGEQDIITLAEKMITFLTSYLEAQVGVFYLLDEKGGNENSDARLKLVASYAYTQRKGMANEFKTGEGLVGQAALEKQKIFVTEIPADYIHIQSGLGEAVPQNIIVIPFMYENAVKGVIEIGSFHKLTEVQLELLEQVMPNIGIAINTADSRTKMQSLLQE
jgi:methyl-accepting chemotaxis protein